jgi:anti-anti-sigma factor
VKRHELTVDRTTDAGADAVVYRLRGVLGDTRPCFELLEEFRRDVPSLPHRILMNVSGVELLTSPGIGVLAACYTTAKNAGRKFFLVGATSQARKSLEATGLLSVLPNYGTDAEAMKAS